MEREAQARAALLKWYRANARDLPLRRTRDPYRILVSEVALQQTRIEQGLPFLERFFEKFPTVESLAAASEEEVLLAWEGLGYYRRARSLRASAKAIVRHHGGRVPSDLQALLDLHGVGPYTAGAVASIAFGKRVPAVDGNAARVLSRFFLIDDLVTTPSGLSVYQEQALAFMGRSAPGTFNQALMELGATLCRPTSPRCGECPIADGCRARREDMLDDFPPRTPSAPLPVVEVAFALVEREGRVLAVRRGKKGLLAGLWALPGGEMRLAESPRERLDRALAAYGLSITGLTEFDSRRKVFSSRVWDAHVYRCEVKGRGSPLEHGRWFSPDERGKVPFVPFQRELLDALDP